MKKFRDLRSLKITAVLLLLLNVNFLIHASDARIKPRVIATTDGEIDDKQSMIRFLLYSCDYDVAGASALWRLKYSGQYSKAQFDRAVSKVRIYCILYQDGGCQWIENNVKEAYIAKSYGLLGTWDYRDIDSRSKNPEEVKVYLNSTWLNANVKTGHGVLGEATPQTWVSEGDTPAFMNFVDNGLEAHQDYSLGGWGGRFANDSANTKPNFVSDSKVTDDGIVMYKSYWRWLIAIQNDFEARMDWCVQPEFKGANHPPKAVVRGSNVQTVKAGSIVRLNASGSSDPDGNELSFRWWQYADADNGHPTIKGYQRVIYTIKK